MPDGDKLDLGDGLSIRTYCAYDDAACRALERTASQFQGFGGLVKAAIVHHAPFDTKPRQFVSGYLLLVCVDERVTTEHSAGSGGAVCGAICVGLKDAFVHGRQRRCGFVFDLRVDERWQRRGIGAALAREAERRSAVRGAEWLYLSVNRDNAKATGLYSKLGWSAASTRRLLFTPLLLPPRCASADSRAVAAGGGIRRCSAEEGAALVARHFAARDLGPSSKEVDAFSKSSLHLGTWVASDGAGSRAALSLWHASSLSSFAPVRLVLPAAVWRRLLWPLLVAATAVITVGASAVLVHPNWLSPACRHAAFLGLSAVTAAGVLLFKWVRSRAAFRARIFAPVYEGNAWQPLMRALHAHLRAEARARGFALVVVNEDAASPLVECLGKKSGRAPTAFLQKWLPQGYNKHQGECASLSPDCFFDPRDI